MTTTSGVFSSIVALLLLSGCMSATPDSAEPTAPTIEEVQETEAPAEPVQPSTATGTFNSDDGQTTGRVEVTLGALTEPDALLATVNIYDLVTPHEHVTVGGALEPRGEDPCFDTGFRSSGGIVVPEGNGSATTTIPAEAEGHTLYEIVLHLDWTQIDSENEPCMQPVIARAPLEWDD